MNNERGLSLIATLWIITILALLAGQFLYSVRLERGIQANLEERIKMNYTARAGIEYFISFLRLDETPYDALDEDWAQGLEGELADAMRSEQTLRFAVQVTDELARININEADEEMINQVLVRAGADETLVQQLVQTVIQARDERPFLTVGDMARVEGMTDDLLYGASSTGQTTETMTADSQEEQPNPLIKMLTTFSLDKNTDAEGNPRVNITSADENALTQIQDAEGNTLFTQGEAQAVIAQRDQQQFSTIGDLLEAPAVSQPLLDSVRDQISTSDEEDKININSADQQKLEQVFGDAGIAQDIIRHRDANGQFGNIDDLRQVRVITTDEMGSFADKLTTVDGDMIPGLININTAPAEVLELLPNMDANKAQAIVAHREAGGDSKGGSQNQTEETSTAFQNVGELLQVDGIDEETFRQIVGRVTYRSQVFYVESSGIAADGKVIGSCVAVIDRSGDTAAYRYWRQN